MITALYFAACRARAGCASEELNLSGLSVAQALERLAELHPDLGTILDQCRVAVNEDFVDGAFQLTDGCELALIPPVGGGDVERERARICETPLSIDAVLDRVQSPRAGGQVVFIGVVRDHTGDEAVDGISYEAYAPMAKKVLTAIAHEVEAAMPEVAVAVDHRVGNLQIGDRAVVVATSAPHRQAAFAACQKVIDRLKEDAPIWKHERRASGLVWVGLGP